MRQPGLVNAGPNGRQKRSDKQERRQHEDRPRLLHPTHIDQRNSRQNEEAEYQLMPVKPRNRAGQCCNTCRNAYSGCQNVVDHQRRGRQQSSLIAQVLARYCERPTTIRIRFDRLPVAEVKNRQQR
jgi:hypothetical protein